MDAAALVAHSMGAAWARGLSPYKTCCPLAILDRFDVVELRGTPALLESWWVIVLALMMYAVKFVADKIPCLDSVWDAARTFVRVPAGALFGASSCSEGGAAAQTFVPVAGGTLAG